MPHTHEHLVLLFWATVSAGAALSAVALVVLSTPAATHLGVPQRIAQDLAVLLTFPLILLAVSCWGQPGMDIGRSVPSRGDLERLVRLKRGGFPQRPDPPHQAAPAPATPVTPPRLRPILVEEPPDANDPVDELAWLLEMKRMRLRERRTGSG
jgi:hypothetical protein